MMPMKFDSPKRFCFGRKAYKCAALLSHSFFSIYCFSGTRALSAASTLWFGCCGRLGKSVRRHCMLFFVWVPFEHDRSQVIAALFIVGSVSAIAVWPLAFFPLRTHTKKNRNKTEHNYFGWMNLREKRWPTYILGLPATAKCGFVGNIFDVNKVGYFGIFQANGRVDARLFRPLPGLWTKCQIGNIAETGDGCRWWN